MIRHIISIVIAVLLSAGMVTSASALPEMKAKLQVSGGGTYDYFILGMLPNATDGFDNAFDTISPGYNMNDTHIFTYFSHPEWNGVKPEYRADIRSIKISQEWMVAVYTNLPAETPLTLSVMPEGSLVPQAYTLTLEDTLTGQTADITSSPYIFNVSANQPLRYFRIISYGEEPKKTLFAVSGTVRDSSGNLISNVRVKLTNDTFGNMTTTTDSNGKFIFTDIPPDTYNLIVHKTGYVFKPFKVVIIDTDITVDVYSTKETGKTK